MTQLTIRAYAAEDAPALAALFFASVRTAGRRDYSDAQVEAWAPAPPDPDRFHARATDGRDVLVATNHLNEPVGYADLERDGHIDHVYCRPDVVGQGVASSLYEALEAVARSRGITRLHVEASEAARRLFAHKRFTLIARRDFDLRGVAIHNYAMEKHLF